MNKPLKILVTAINGDLSQAIVKSLKLAEFPVDICGMDASNLMIGAAWVDNVKLAPLAKDPGYFPALEDYITHIGADVLIPGSDPELIAISKHYQTNPLPNGCRLLAHRWPWLEVFGDKLRCNESLRKKGVSLAPFCDGDSRAAVELLTAKHGFPLIVKERVSCGSRSIHRVETSEKLHSAIRKCDSPIVQGYLDDADGEFSVGAFRSDNFSVAIVFRRTLFNSAGLSWYADNLIEYPEIEKYALDIAEACDLRGSCNIQVRSGKNGIGLLEINPRFSSLVAARAVAGFRDLEWAVQMLLGNEPDLSNLRIKPLRFQRFFHELFDFGKGFVGCEQMAPRRTNRLGDDIK